MSFDATLASYKSLLEANPGKALRIDVDCYAVIQDGSLCGVYCDLDGQVDLTSAFDFDRNDWNTDCECWDGDSTGLETAFGIANPEFRDLS